MHSVADKTSKRERLIKAAVTCLHHQGYARMTLAQVAGEAGVPVGNIYYYFRTKAELAIAVFETWQGRLQEIYAEINLFATPEERLHELLIQWVAERAVYAEFGCPLANLARDLRSAREPEIAACAGQVYASLYEWVQAQFVATGFDHAMAKTRANFMVASLQGGILMAHAQNQAELAYEQAEQLGSWLTATLKEHA